MPFFHVSEPGYFPGHIIKAGRWGSLVLADNEHRWFGMETLFENVRLQIAPHLPSRLRSAYMFDDFESAAWWAKRSPGSKVYSVEVVSPAALIYRASLGLVHPELDRHYGDGVTVGNAQAYWSGVSEAELWELLVESDLRVISFAK